MLHSKELQHRAEQQGITVQQSVSAEAPGWAGSYVDSSWRLNEEKTFLLGGNQASALASNHVKY